MSKRVLVVVRSLKVGGMERVAVNLCDGLAELGHEAHLLTFKDAEPALAPTESVITHKLDLDRQNRRTVIGLLYDLVVRVPFNLFIRKSGFIWRGYYAAPLFMRAVQQLESQYGPFDAIIVRGQGTFENLWRVRDARMTICLENNINLDPDTWKGRWFARTLYQDKNIVCVSRGVQENFEEFAARAGVAARRLRVITNPMPIDQIRTMADEACPQIPKEPYIVNVARLVPQKGQERLLRAYALSGVSERLVIVGGGRLEGELKALARELGIAERVTFTGTVLNPYPWMKHAKLFVLSSEKEGLGIVLVESLACGTPVVSVDCPGGIRDVLVEEQAELICDMTPEALAETIKKGLVSAPEPKKEWLKKFEAAQVVSEFLR